MNIKTLIGRALKKNPIVAEAMPDNGLAILYTVRDEVLVLKVDMDEQRLEAICHHVSVHGEPRIVADSFNPQVASAK